MKRVIIDTASRLERMPPGLLAFERQESRLVFRPVLRMIDLATISSHTPHTTAEPADSWFTPADKGTLTSAREMLAAWIEQRFTTAVHPVHGIFLARTVDDLLLALTMSLLEAGDLAMLPELAEPSIRQAIVMADAQPSYYGLDSRDQWSVDLTSLQGRIGQAVRLFFACSPHHPTGRTLGRTEWEEIGACAEKRNWAIVHDARWSNPGANDDYGFWQLPQAEHRGVMLLDLARQFGLPDGTLACMVGHAQILHAVKLYAQVVPLWPSQGSLLALQQRLALPHGTERHPQRSVRAAAAEIEELLKENQLRDETTGDPPWRWVRLPQSADAVATARTLFRRQRILVIPGTPFGERGAHYLRLSLSADADDYREARQRLARRRFRRGSSERA